MEGRAATTLGCWGTVVEPLHNWDGTYGDLLLSWNRGCGEVAGIWDGAGNRVATFPVDGRMMRGDVCGDDRTEVVDYVMGDHAYVYANGPCDLAAKVTGRSLPQAKRLYDYSRYTAEEIPADLAAGHRWCTPGPAGWQRRPGPAAGADRRPARLRHPPARRRYRVEVSADGRHWTTVARGLHRWRDGQRVEFTGLGRHIRVSGEGPGPAPRFGATVLGTR